MQKPKEMDIQTALDRQFINIDNPWAAEARFNRDPGKFMEQEALMELALKKERMRQWNEK